MEEFLREIQEDMEREKYRVLWQRYGRIAIALAVAVGAFTVGVQVWKSTELAAHEKSTDVLIAASEKKTLEAWQEAANQLKGDAKAIALLNRGAYAEAEKAADDVGIKSLARAHAGATSVDKDEPVSAVVREAIALRALADRDVEAAKTQFAAIEADQQAPASLRARAIASSQFITQHPDAFTK